MWKLMGGLLALPVLLVLSVLMIFWGSGDYVRTVQLNWELELPASEGCLYSSDNGTSPLETGNGIMCWRTMGTAGWRKPWQRKLRRSAPQKCQ